MRVIGEDKLPTNRVDRYRTLPPDDATSWEIGVLLRDWNDGAPLECAPGNIRSRPQAFLRSKSAQDSVDSLLQRRTQPFHLVKRLEGGSQGVMPGCLAGLLPASAQ